MQPSAHIFGHCGYRAEAPTSFPSLPPNRPFGTNSFNFRDLSMKKSTSDYFTVKPVRGSSPTASLAADLSQNFHIDKSPQLPTPRRALFSTNFNHNDSFTTPPLTSSSPGMVDMMDVSPLPHKPPFGAIELQLQSPSPEPTPSDHATPSVASEVESPFQPSRLQIPHERKRSNPLRRPSLTKTKGFSTNTLPTNDSIHAQHPFLFGNGINKPAHSSSLSLSDMFEESPQSKAGLKPTITAMGPPRPKAAFPSLMSNRSNGSPIGAHVRKNSNPLLRPRKQVRRSLSMFEHPDEMFKADKSEPMPSIMDIEGPSYVPQLPHFVPDGETLPRITKETLVDVLDGKHNEKYEKLVIIDCRFEYEYNGGHIAEAVNFNDKEALSSRLFNIEPTSKALLVFHCEYSAHRAPIMAKFIRHKDRAVNTDNYPYLTYPELYILDGGYSSFFSDYRSRCFPQNYVEMGDKEHEHACERGLGKVKQRSKLLRAQTFAFGQQSPGMDDSPTGPPRSRQEIGMDIQMSAGLDSSPFASFSRPQLPGRRMFSAVN
ncbi:putative m-phase inducer phosphatase [Phaeomoniella chlamydospora]|uniref:M-phase inducer phosphatase n=1 Tax=Phaeomoniella chlamydospora TaxID=158046 RepID=A0A0G2FTG8_PHACM|nr:putative m-phase inducer phosphatase [Phaeomoniella chlamydospora]